MSCGRKLVIFLMAFGLRAENMQVNQPGISVPVNAWTQVCPGTGCNGQVGVHATGFDNFVVTGTGQVCLLGGFNEITTEQNRTLWCWDFATNRWSIMDIAGGFGSQHMTSGGHPDDVLAADPTSSYIFLVQSSGSGSSGTDSSFQTFVYDTVGQYGRMTNQLSKPLANSREGAAIYDYTRVASSKQGLLVDVENPTGTAEYDPWANSWSTAYCTSGGTGCPPTGIHEACMVWDDINQTIYLFGGVVGSTPQNTVYANNQGSWSVLTTTGTPPSARIFPGCAFNRNRNHLFVFSGCTIATCASSSTVSDTWILDFSQTTPTWSQLSPSVIPSLSGPVYERVSYLSAYDAYVTLVQPTVGNHQTWVYREDPGPNVGFAGNGSGPTPAGINRSTGNWAKAPALDVNGSVASAAWIETGNPGSTSCPGATGVSCYQHPNATSFLSTSWVPLPNPATDLSVMPLQSGQYTISDDASCAYVSGTFWCEWWAYNAASVVARMFAGSFGGSSWTTASLGYVGSPNPSQGGMNQILNVNSVPTAAFRENDTTVSPNRSQLYVKQFVSGSWGSALGGAALNRNTGTNPVTRAQFISSAATTGSNFCVAHTEYTETTSGAIVTTGPMAYVDCWNGSSWSAQGGNIAVSSSDSVMGIGLTAIGTTIYACLIERNQNGTGAGFPSGTQLVYLLSSAVGSGTWTELGGANQNRDAATGWATDCSLTNDGTNVYLAWSEQNNEAPWTAAVRLTSTGQKGRVFVEKWNGSAFSDVGACLNNDCLNGSAERPDIAITSGNPVAIWEEKQFGGLQQIYSKQWNGTDWAALAITPLSRTQIGNGITGANGVKFQ